MNTEKRRSLWDKPKPVIQRWWRIKMIRCGVSLARFYMRWRLPIKERNRRRVLNETFEAVKNQTIGAEKRKLHSSLVISNAALYFLLIERDIQSLKIAALTSSDEWTRKLYTRVMMLTVHEWDMAKVTGKNFQEALVATNIAPELKKRLDHSLRQVRKSQEAIKQKFGLLRNETIAHRSGDALAQYRAIRNLDVEDSFQSVANFYASIEQFIGVMPEVIIATSTGPGLLNQFLRKYSK